MWLKYIFWLFVTKIMFISQVTTRSSNLPRNYDAKQMPLNTTNEGGKVPVKVMVGMTIKGVNVKDEHKEYISIEIKLKIKLTWLDSRLKRTSRDPEKYIFITNEEDIWKPPLVLLQTDGEFKNQYCYFRIYPNSTVMEYIFTTITLRQLHGPDHSGPISISLACMDHTTDELTLQWNEINPISGYSLYYGEDFENRTCNMSFARLSRGRGGKHSCLEISIGSKRHKYPFIFMVYIPGIIIVMISWLCFWIALPGVLANTATSTACMIHLYIQQMSIIKDWPPLENHRTLNYWLDGCIGFVLTRYFIMVFVTYLHITRDQRFKTRSGTERLSAATTVPEEEEAGIVEGSGAETNTLCNHFHFLRIWFNRFPSTADEINAICRVLFPLCFLIFMCVFFFGNH